MIIKKSKIFLPLFIASSLLFSCKKLIDDAFANPNATVRVPIETLLPGVIGNMVANSSAAGSAYGTGNDGININRYVQNWGSNLSGLSFDQMGGVTGSSDVNGSVWAMLYYGMGTNLKRIIEWGIEEKKWDYVGVGHAIFAWAWLTTTDQYGEIILTEAFRPSQLVFKYNDQKEVYDSVRTMCRAAIAYLNTTGDNASQANLAIGDAYFYNGDVNKWKKFVYSVMARSFNHLSNKRFYNADSVLFYSNLAINTNADNATAKFANTGVTGTSNWFGPFRGNAGSLRQSNFIANILNGTNPRFSGVVDPRAPYLIRENANGTYRGVRVGSGSTGLAAADQPFNFWGGTFGTTASPSSDADARYIFKNGSPLPIITAAEIKFMTAEAQLRKGNKAAALAAYKDAINLNFDMLANEYATSVPGALLMTPTSRTSYINNPNIVPVLADNLTLTHIMMQKYIAMYGFGMQETWVDMRRFHYTDLDPATGAQVYTDFVPPSPLFVNNSSKLVYRCRPRFNSEYLYNVAELTRIGAMAVDYHTKECWFSIVE